MSKHTTIDQLKMLAQRSKAEIDKVDGKVTALSSRVDSLVGADGEPLVIASVKFNGETLEVAEDKSVSINAATKEDVAAAIAASDHLKRKIVTSVSDIDLTAADADKFIYMVPNGDTDDNNQYDEYMVLSGKIEYVGNTKVNMDGKVDKEDGKGLSTNDYTDEEKQKLADIEMATDTEVGAMLDEVFGGIASEESTKFSAAEDVAEEATVAE